MLIYLLEDDPSIRELVTYALSTQQMPAQGFATPSAFWKAMETQVPDLLLLDIMLPEEDGLTVLQKLRQRRCYHTLPVILLTAKNTEYDKVMGLDGGADDFVSKPFGMMELLARVRAVLRRAEKPAQAEEYRVGSLWLSQARRQVTVSGAEVQLTYKEFELLTVLMANAGRALSRSVLMDQVWGGEFPRENRTLDVHIRTLRAKLGAAGEMITTVRGVGYKLEALP